MGVLAFTDPEFHAISLRLRDGAIIGHRDKEESLIESLDENKVTLNVGIVTDKAQEKPIELPAAEQIFLSSDDPIPQKVS